MCIDIDVKCFKEKAVRDLFVVNFCFRLVLGSCFFSKIYIYIYLLVVDVIDDPITSSGPVVSSPVLHSTCWTLVSHAFLRNAKKTENTCYPREPGTLDVNYQSHPLTNP